jgi:alpha-lytic endopeptidase
MSLDSKCSPMKPMLLSIATAAALALTAGAAAAVEITPELRAAMKRDLGLAPGQLPQLIEIESRANAQADQARAQLGADFAGAWLERATDGSTKLVVAAAGHAKALRIAGSELRHVRYSLAALDAAVAHLNAQMKLPMIARQPQIHSWYADVKTNKVVVTVDEGALETGIDFIAASAIDPSMVRFETSRARPQTAIDLFGGQFYGLTPPIGQPGACSTGFNARNSSGTRYVITAGHCGPVGTTTRIGSGASLGVIDGSVFPGSDMAVMRITNSAIVQRGRVVNYSGGSIPVSGSTPALVGASICRSGNRTGYRCGVVRAINVSVTYPGGTVNGLTETSACNGQGDSGGSYITTAGQAQGVASGGAFFPGFTENCSTGGTPITWHQPVRPILTRYGLSLLLGP